MARLDTRKLHVTFAPGVAPRDPMAPRVYTLTHSDSTGELFLTVGAAVDRRQISGWYTRLMRDEVIAEWGVEEEPTLHVHCHVSGGVVVGTAGWRDGIFRRHLPLVLEAFRYGDREFFAAHPGFDDATVRVHFHSGRRRYDTVETWSLRQGGSPGE